VDTAVAGGPLTAWAASERRPDGVADAGRLCRAAGVLAAARDGGAAAVVAGVAGADVGVVPGGGVLPAPYMYVPVPWTAPGSRAMPLAVAWLPSVSVSLIVNGPDPAPDCAIQAL
jgi:hypothetical protein